MRVISIRLDDQVAANLDTLAGRAGLSAAAYLEAMLAGKFDDPTRPTRRERRAVAAKARKT